MFGTLKAGRLAVVLAALLLAACLAAPAAQARRMPGPTLSLMGDWASEAAVKDSDGKVSSYRLGAKVSIGGFYLSAARTTYLWTDAGRLPMGAGGKEPWEHLNLVRAGFQYERGRKRRLGWFAGGEVHSGWEEDLDGESVGAFAYLGANYTFGNKVLVRLGALGVYHKAESLVLPVVGVRWNMDARKGLMGDVGFPRTTVAWRFNPTWAIRLDGMFYDSDYYRLADNSPLESKGFLEQRQMSADLGMEFRPVTDMIIFGGVRYLFNREYKVWNQDGENERSYDVDPSWGLVFSMDWRF